MTSSYHIVRECPRCHGNAVCRSRRRHTFEALLLPLVLLRPFRCMGCYTRYYGFLFAQR